MNKTHNTALTNFIKAGSYKACCDYVEQNRLYPLVDNRSLKLINLCVRHLKPHSQEHLVKFVKYTNFKDLNLANQQLSDYITCGYYIVQFLAGQVDCNLRVFRQNTILRYLQKAWQLILDLRDFLIPPYIQSISGSTQDIFMSTVSVLLTALKSSTMSQENMLNLTKLVIKMTAYYDDHAKRILCFWTLTGAFQNHAFCARVGQMCVEAGIMKQKTEITASNFDVMMSLLSASFVHSHYTLYKADDDLIMVKCIQKLQEHVKDTAIQGTMRYLQAVTKTLLPIQEFTDDKLHVFVEPLKLLNTLYKNAKIHTQLQAVSAFCHKKNAIYGALNHKCQLPPRNFTKQLQDFVQVCLSHAKSNAMILKKKLLSSPTCCAQKNYHVAAVQVQNSAYEFIVNILRQVTDQSTISGETFQHLYKMLEKCFQAVSEILAFGCRNATPNLKQLAIASYNYSTILYQCPSQKETNSMFLHLLTKQIYAHSDKEVFTPKMAATITYAYAEYLLEKDRRRAMDVCALFLHQFGPDITPSIEKLWNATIHNCKEEYKAVLICEVLEENSNFAQELAGRKIILKDAQRVQLLRLEINGYVKRYQAIDRIQKCLSCLWDLIGAREYVEVLLKLPFEVFILLKPVEFIKDKRDIQDELHQAVHAFFVHIYEYEQALVVCKELRDEQMPSEEDSSPNALFNLNYDHLRVNKYAAMMAHLKTSYEHFTKATIPGDNKTVLELLMYMGHLFDAHGNESLARRTFYLAINCAQSQRNPQRILQVITFILQYEADITHLQPAIPDLEHPSIDLRTRFIYHSSLATWYLKHDRLKEFRAAYTHACDDYYACGGTLYVEDEPDFDLDIARGYYALMAGEGMMLPCAQVAPDDMDGHGAPTVVVLHDALWHLLMHRNRRHMNRAEYLALIVRLGELLVTKYYWTEAQREGIQVVHSLLVIADSALLTYRVCRLLVFSGRLDLLHGQVENCRCAANALSRILHIEYAVDLAVEFERKVLIASSSPVAVMRGWRAPEFASHADTCACEPCTSRTYQRVVFDYLHLEALIACHHGDDENVCMYLEHLNRFYIKLAKAKKFHYLDGNLDVLWTTVKLHHRNGNTSAMERSIRKLETLLDQQMYRNFYLYDMLMTMKVASTLAARKTHMRPPPVKTPEINLESGRSRTPTFETPRITIKPPARVASSAVVPLDEEVPDMGGGRRTRLKIRKNLGAELAGLGDEGPTGRVKCQASKSEDPTGKTKSKSDKKATTTRRGLR